ncbi:MAG: hypothetical protein HY985_14760 [Magnetospirillum sp.]|nr:hypothetical protein [Magnetospirillum sp.]
MARREVTPGQRFQTADSVAVWEVRELTRDSAGVPHARLVRVGDPTATKMISVSALRDPRLYRSLPSPSGEPD